jgi:glyoxylase-like metal-dependent hydrolase (beta-lactamase superfamily II)
VRIRCLTTGAVREKAGERGVSRYIGDRWRPETLPVHAFLVEHPDGLLLFDTGQTARAAGPGYLPRWHPFLRLSRFELDPGDEVAAQLRRLGIAPGDIRWVVLSHLHTDHVGGLDDFRNGEVLVSRAEWESGSGLGGRLRGYLPQYWPRGLEPRLLDLDDDGFGPFPGSYDVAGDGSLLVVATPGHTPGHASLLVRRAQGGVLLAGDLAHTAADLDRVSPSIALYCRDHGIAFACTHDGNAREAVANGLQRPHT